MSISKLSIIKDIEEEEKREKSTQETILCHKRREILVSDT